MDRTLAYLTYGSQRQYALELTYSVASALRFYSSVPDIRIVLVTDRAGSRPDLPVEHHYFDERLFAEWTRNGSYTHAAKIHALRLVLDRFGGSVALLDTDTFFTGHPERLFNLIGPGRSVMHASEGAIGAHDEWRPLIERCPQTVAGFDVDANSPMNNSGVVGLHARERALTDRCIDVMHQLREISPIFSIEQFAITTVLASQTQITAVSDLVEHYWGIRRRFVHGALNARLPTLTRCAFDDLLVNFEQLGLPRKRRLDQARARLRGWAGGWSPSYRFAYLAYRSALSASPPWERDAWAATAADFLFGEGVAPVRIQRDFPEVAAGTPDWMSPQTRNAWRSLVR